MCVTSMISDHYGKKWTDQYPDVFQPKVIPTWPPAQLPQQPTLTQEQIDKLLYKEVPLTRKEFDELKKEVQEMKELMLKAIKYDEVNNEPKCAMDEKVELITKIAELVGVDMNEVLKGLQK